MQLTSAARFDSEMEKLRYFVGQMEIRNKNPSLFRAFGFRPLVEKCSVRATKSYICPYRSVLPRDCSLGRAFSVCDLCVGVASHRIASRRTEIFDFQSRRESHSIIDRPCAHMEEHKYSYINIFSFSCISFYLPMLPAINWICL